MPPLIISKRLKSDLGNIIKVYWWPIKERQVGGLKCEYCNFTANIRKLFCLHHEIHFSDMLQILASSKDWNIADPFQLKEFIDSLIGMHSVDKLKLICVECHYKQHPENNGLKKLYEEKVAFISGVKQTRQSHNINSGRFQ